MTNPHYLEESWWSIPPHSPVYVVVGLDIDRCIMTILPLSADSNIPGHFYLFKRIQKPLQYFGIFNTFCNNFIHMCQFFATLIKNVFFNITKKCFVLCLHYHHQCNLYESILSIDTAATLSQYRHHQHICQSMHSTC